MESWDGFKEAIIKRFDRKILFHVALQKVEARKWQFTKETFGDYAMEKLMLMHRLDLSDQEAIHLLIGGITSRSLRGTASALQVETMDKFFEEMHRITTAMMETERKSFNTNYKTDKDKDARCTGCGKKGHAVKQCRTVEITCFLCKKKGHYKTDFIQRRIKGSKQ